MKKFFREVSKIAKLLDISPIDGGSIPKVFIYLIWGLNAAIFLGEDIVKDHIFYNESTVSITSSTNCTILKKVNSDADLSESIEVVNSSGFIILPTNDRELAVSEVLVTEKSRAPPAGTALV